METWEGGGAPVYVTLDLETTGLDPDRDAIIEIGAVKFQGHRVLENFQTLVNPYREIPQAIVRLTGIAQRSVDRAPPFAAVAGELSEFLGALPVVGHHVSFDLGFLAKHGLRLENEVYDTWDLAAVVLPSSSSYSLSELASGFKVEHRQPHRALSDAQATHGVFVGLLERAGALDPATLAYIQHMGARSRWSTGRLFGALRSLDAEVRDSRLGMTGLDTPSLSKRLGRTDRSLRPVKEQQSLDEGELAAYMAPGGLFSRAFPGFERRPQQAEMMAAVTAAFNRGGHLMVEAGTGVGKSLAYLLPALLHSVRNGARVVVSTNTINLQEQLLMKDIPALARVLEEERIVPEGQIKSVPLKGRTNYLCLRRWSHLARSDGLSGDDARVLSKALVWLQDTATGDRGEINLSGRDIPAWSRISAGDVGQCPGLRGEGPCFLRAARDRAESAHILVVNHALLLADMAIGGGLIPEYQHLIVDEAHHLEEAATHQLGFRVSQGLLDDEMDALSRLLASARALVRGTSSSSVQVKRAEEMVSELETTWGARAPQRLGQAVGRGRRVHGGPTGRGSRPASAIHHPQHQGSTGLVRGGDGLGEGPRQPGGRDKGPGQPRRLPADPARRRAPGSGNRRHGDIHLARACRGAQGSPGDPAGRPRRRSARRLDRPRPRRQVRLVPHSPPFGPP